MRKITVSLVVWGLLVSLVVAFDVHATLVKFDFAGNLKKSWGTINENTPFQGYLVYDSEAEGIWVKNNPGIPEDPPDNGWEKRQYPFVEFYLTVDGQTFSMSGHEPTDRSANPYGTIFITKFPDPNVDQFFVSLSPLYHGFGSTTNNIPNYIWKIGDKEVRQIQVAFSSENLFEDTGPYLLEPDLLQQKFDESTRAVMTLVAPDYYTVSSPLKEGEASPVPEPSTSLLLGIGLLIASGMFRKKLKD